jgi:hypothetical protein
MRYVLSRAIATAFVSCTFLASLFLATGSRPSEALGQTTVPGKTCATHMPICATCNTTYNDYQCNPGVTGYSPGTCDYSGGTCSSYSSNCGGAVLGKNCPSGTASVPGTNCNATVAYCK